MLLPRILNALFSTYEILLLVRVLSSWFTELQALPLIQQIGSITEPYLRLFRRLLPPLAGVIDLSPTLALLALHFARQKLMLWLFGTS